MGRARWYPLSIKELKTFVTCSLYMGMKKLPNNKKYGAKLEKFFYCHPIVGLLTRKGYMALIWCLHIKNLSMYVNNRNSLLYDKNASNSMVGE